MKERQEFHDTLLALGKAALPLAIPGAAAGIEVVKKVIEVIDKADALIEHKSPELIETRDELHARVNAHVGDVVDQLRGT